MPNRSSLGLHPGATPASPRCAEKPDFAGLSRSRFIMAEREGFLGIFRKLLHDQNLTKRYSLPHLRSPTGFEHLRSAQCICSQEADSGEGGPRSPLTRILGRGGP